MAGHTTEDGTVLSDASQLELLPNELTIRTTSSKSEKANLGPLQPTFAYDLYWYLAAERQRIFFNRLAGAVPPWTEDIILKTYKFTNAYRASDRTSQYLIRHVIYNNNLPQDDLEMYFRIILFKLFNKISTWEWLTNTLGPLTWESYSFEEYDQVLTEVMSSGESIYSSAYIMPSGNKQWGHTKKHRNHLEMLARMMQDKMPVHLSNTKRMQEGYDLFYSYPTIGPFLAYQLITDVNYSPIVNYSELEFVVPGPGALSGLRKCFHSLGGLNESEVIKFVADRQEQEFERLGITFLDLWGRRLQLIDCQNLFCEIDKYLRVSNPEHPGIGDRTRIKHRFIANNNQTTLSYPPKWGINNRLQTLPTDTSK